MRCKHKLYVKVKPYVSANACPRCSPAQTESSPELCPQLTLLIHFSLSLYDTVLFLELPDRFSGGGEIGLGAFLHVVQEGSVFPVFYTCCFIDLVITFCSPESFSLSRLLEQHLLICTAVEQMDGVFQ